MARDNRPACGSGISIPGVSPSGWQQATKLMLLSREKRTLLEQRCPPSDIGPDPIDAARELEEERLWVAVLDRCDKMQDQITEALRLLGESRYGRCTECDVSIPPARLRVLPFAVRCVACQEQFERQSAVMAVPRSAA